MATQTPETMRLALESMRLALEAIAAMEQDEKTNPEHLLTLCITIARIELAKDFDGVLAVMDNAIETITA